MDTELKQNSKAFTEKVKAALDIIQVVEKTVPLQKESDEWYAGATSQNSQSGKSLKVNCREQWYKNFASGDGGDVLDWIAFANNLDIKQDFPEILKIAADLAGIPFEVSESDKQFAEETRIIQDTLTQAAEIYHSNLTPIIRAYINKKWGISDSTIDALKIGYASTSYDIMGRFDIELLKQTGLLVKVGDTFKEHFTGRVVFPYWSNGKVVNFAARGDKDFLGTPDNKYEEAKYKKLLVHNDRHNYVHSSVNNRYIFGEDTIRKQDFCVITEGIADSIVLIQNGYPVLSPVTVQFSEKDIDNLIHAAKRLKTVYICNDNEDSGAGEKGAIKTALLLKNIGVDVKITLLPKENLSKMDVAEYFLRHTNIEFEAVRNNSDDVLVFLLNKVPVSKNADISKSKTENMQNAVTFVKNTLTKIQNEDDAAFFIRNNIKNYFPKFTTDDIRALVKVYKNNISTDQNNSDFDKKLPFDLDSESGRSAMIQTLTKEVMEQKKLKFIAGSLRMYDQGIYSATPEAIMKLHNFIVELAAEHKTPIVKKHTKSVVEMLEIKNTAYQHESNTLDEEIAVNNGILNLKTFELSEFTPDKVFFNKLPVDYLPNAPEPTQFLKFMDDVFKNNDVQLKVIQEIFGYCLTNNYKYQDIFYLLGDGGNGKGTTIRILSYLLGPENTSSATLLQLTDHNNVDYFIAALHGKKANICGDIGTKKVENTENIKKLSSNTDLISARLPYGMPFDFVNKAKLIFALNKMPRKDAFTTGDKRRDVIINFKNHISDSTDEVRGLSEIIRDSGEMPGILNWSIEGLKRLERNRDFSDKKTVAQKGLEYDMMSNPMKYFVDDCIEEDLKGGYLPNVLIYNAYTQYRKLHCMPEISEIEIKNGLKYWCEQIGIKTQEKRIRVEKLLGFDLDEDFKTRLGKQPHVFTGIKLTTDEKETEDSVNKKLSQYNEPVKSNMTEKQQAKEALFD